MRAMPLADLDAARPRVVLFTREYPPEVYGGAGVHVEYLARELGRRTPVEVRCFGEPRPGGPGAPEGAVRAFRTWPDLDDGTPDAAALRVLATDLAMATDLPPADVAHSHTWYANFAGYLAKLIRDIPHVVTSHSLEPLRPWKAEQLGTGGYAVSRFCERTALEDADAVVAVSLAMREDLLKTYPAIDPDRVQVIHNGIDPEEYRPDSGLDVLDRYGVDPGRPTVVFVGRITRQKGLPHLLDAAVHLDPEAQLVLCAGAADTPEIHREVSAKVDRIRDRPGGVMWIDRMLERREVVQLLSHATVFCCPSVYEPLGIVNLEAMACGAAVVATATGGIPEVVEDGVTGYLVPIDPADPSGSPRDPDRLALELAGRLNAMLGDPAGAERMGRAGRDRVVERFTWAKVAERTLELYRRLIR